jgi:hypothetical protein
MTCRTCPLDPGSGRGRLEPFQAGASASDRVAARRTRSARWRPLVIGLARIEPALRAVLPVGGSVGSPPERGAAHRSWSSAATDGPLAWHLSRASPAGETTVTTSSLWA